MLRNSLKTVDTSFFRARSYVDTKFFSVSSVVQAKSAPKQKDGKKKAKLGFKNKAVSGAPKAKKGGMTHLGFRDAVRALGFERSGADVEKLGVNELTYSGLAAQDSTMVKYGRETQEILASLELFKKYQHHELVRNPVSMVTANTCQLDNKFLIKLDNSSRDNRLCLIGEKGLGKSFLLAQANALALSKYDGDVILLHLDHPERIVEGSSDYIFNKRMNKYQQPMFTKRWIKKLRSANENIFKKLPLTRDISFTAKKVDYDLKKDKNSLYDYILHNHDFGKVGSSTAFSFLIEEIKHHSKTIPVLVSIDNINAFTSDTFTKYRHPDFKRIHFSEFEMGDFILKLLSGDLCFDKGGVLMAESRDLAQNLTLKVGLELEEYDPYYRKTECDAEVVEHFLANGGVDKMELHNFTKSQCRELMRFWSKAGILQVREYPTVEDFNSSEESALAGSVQKTESLPNDFQEPFQHQFETLVNNNYVISAGNPGHLLKTVSLSY